MGPNRTLYLYCTDTSPKFFSLKNPLDTVLGCNLMVIIPSLVREAKGRIIFCKINFFEKSSSPIKEKTYLQEAYEGLKKFCNVWKIITKIGWWLRIVEMKLTCAILPGSTYLQSVLGKMTSFMSIVKKRRRRLSGFDAKGETFNRDFLGITKHSVVQFVSKTAQAKRTFNGRQLLTVNTMVNK